LGALEQQRHHEEAEQTVAILRDLRIRRGNQCGPIQVEMPAEEEIVPTGRNTLGQRRRRDLHHGDDAHRKGGDGENAELHHLCDHHAEHAALDDVNGGDRDQRQRVLIRTEIPGQEGGREFSDALESVTEEPDDTEESVDNDNDVRQVRAAAFAETRLDPIGARHGVGPAQPGRHEHHQEDLVEGGPQPRNPHAFHAVDERPIDQKHRAADIEHAGRVRDPEHVPGHGIASQEVRLHVLGGAMRNPIAHHDGGCQIHQNDCDIDSV
jgi:hypothetical protein